MAQQSFEDWLSSMTTPVKEFCSALWYSMPERAVRYTACTLFGVAAVSGVVAIGEMTVGGLKDYPDTKAGVAAENAAEASQTRRVEVEAKIAMYGTLAGLGVMAAGAVASRRQS